MSFLKAPTEEAQLPSKKAEGPFALREVLAELSAPT
jgi:hypothetical protein